ncbi:hypothetical protein ACIQ9Q_10690 [Streptomyces sp. NPDC094438]
MLLVPFALAGCGWLAQTQGTLTLSVSVVLLLVVLIGAWVMCGPGPGACVVALAFCAALFIGPALNDHMLDQRGVRYPAVIADVQSFYRKHGDGRTCKVVRTDVVESAVYSVGDMGDGCEDNVREGQHVTLVVDPQGRLSPRLSGSVNGASGALLWTCGGLLAAMEAFILYGRLRRRRA